MSATANRTCKLFLSWSHVDARLKKAFGDDRLLHALGNIGDVSFEWWEDSHLLAGDMVDPAISRRVAEADFGVLLLSPAYFGSNYIRDKELPSLLGPQNRILPVALRPFGQFNDGMDFAGIDKTWVLYENGKSFSELNAAGRDRFALKVAAGIRRRVLGLDGWRAL